MPADFEGLNFYARLEYDRLQVGQALRGYRLERGFTQAEIAWRSGITQGALSNYENGKRDVPLPALIAVCRVLGLYPAQIVPALAPPAAAGA